MNETVPVGVEGVPVAEVSVTVTVHLAAWRMATGLSHARVVEVDRVATVRPLLALLPLWATSPPYVAVTVEDPALDATSRTLQLAVPAELPGTSLHGEPVKIATTPLCEKLTVPLTARRLEAVEGCSVTVAVQVEA